MKTRINTYSIHEYYIFYPKEVERGSGIKRIGAVPVKRTDEGNVGEAKRRGSMNERTKAAKDRESSRIAAMAETMNIQFDEDQYLYCLTIYQAAAGMSMPVENPENKKIRIEGYGTVAFTDNAMNRGMLAVSKELTDQGMDHRERMAMVSRVMHFGDIVEAKDRFSRWIQPSTEEGALSINEALMRAGATARIIVSDDHMGFDLDDVERLAESIAKRLDDEDGGVSS